MKTGIFCNYENHHQNVSLAIEEQSQLIQHAESLGFDTAWITEHHFNDFSTSASILMLIAHLSAITSTIKLGTAALLLPFHQPLRVAEDIATLNHAGHFQGRSDVCLAYSFRQRTEFSGQIWIRY